MWGYAKKMMLLLLILGGCLLLSLLAYAWPNIGKGPSKEQQSGFLASPNYDEKQQRFVNRNQEEYDQMLNNFDTVQILKEQIFGTQQRTPPQELPQQPIDWQQWESNLEGQQCQEPST